MPTGRVPHALQLDQPASEAAGEARHAFEEEHFPNGIHADAPPDMLPGRRWNFLMKERPDYRAVVDTRANALQAEDDAFAVLLRAAPTASPAGFLALARHACELTFDSEGHACEGASYAYRALAAFAGRPVFGEEIRGVLEDEEEV